MLMQSSLELNALLVTTSLRRLSNPFDRRDTFDGHFSFGSLLIVVAIAITLLHSVAVLAS